MALQALNHGVLARANSVSELGAERDQLILPGCGTGDGMVEPMDLARKRAAPGTPPAGAEAPDSRHPKRPRHSGLQASPLDRALEIFKRARPDRPVPVTVLSGFLGSGKTTLVNRILREDHGLKVAVVVNDMNVLNVDARLMEGNINTSNGETLVELSNGCICCTLREDLLAEVAALVVQGKYDYVLIESTGISEPMPVAAIFSTDDVNGNNLQRWVKIDTMVTVVDASRLTNDIESIELLRDRSWQANDNDERGIADLMVDQIEFADVILLNKTDRVPADMLPLLEAMLRKLNPRASLMRTAFCAAPLTAVIGTGKFSMKAAKQAAGWAQELMNSHPPEEEEFNIGSMLYTRKRPFHPERLWNALSASEGGIPALLRIKGFCWMADQGDVVWEWSSVGASMMFKPFGVWKAASLPRESWPLGEDQWDEHWGDRTQQVVFIGQHLPREQITSVMDACLLTDEEVIQGEDSWKNFTNPMCAFSEDGSLYLDMK